MDHRFYFMFKSLWIRVFMEYITCSAVCAFFSTKIFGYNRNNKLFFFFFYQPLIIHKKYTKQEWHQELQNLQLSEDAEER